MCFLPEKLKNNFRVCFGKKEFKNIHAGGVMFIL